MCNSSSIGGGETAATDLGSGDNGGRKEAETTMTRRRGSGSSPTSSSSLAGDDDDEALLLAAIDEAEFEELTAAVVDVDRLMERRAAHRAPPAGRRDSGIFAPGGGACVGAGSSNSPGCAGGSRSGRTAAAEEHELPWRRPGPPRLPLGTYGGALVPIDEAPRLQSGAMFAPTHRFSACLALPSCSFEEDEVPEDLCKLRGGDDLIVDFPHNLQLNDDNNDDDAGLLLDEKKEIDPRGRCIRHPHVQLRKKNPFGCGWKVLLRVCPDCCMEELHRLHSGMNSDDMRELRRLHLGGISEDSDEECDGQEGEKEARPSSRSKKAPQSESGGGRIGTKINVGRGRRRRKTEETLRDCESVSPPPRSSSEYEGKQEGKSGSGRPGREAARRSKSRIAAGSAGDLLRRRSASRSRVAAALGGALHRD